MAIIDPEGLFNGDRLRRCSNNAQLHWPRLYLASDGYGRFEMNYAKLLQAYSTFSPLPTEAELRSYLEEYATNSLLFVYVADGQLWGQWDTKTEFLPRYKTSADRRSPIPPQNAFTEWKRKYREQTRLLPKSFRNFSETFQTDAYGGGVGVGGVEVSSDVTGTPTPPPSEINSVKRTRFAQLYQNHPYPGKRPEAETAYGRILDGAVDQAVMAATIDTAHATWTAYWAGRGKAMYVPFLAEWLTDEKYLRTPPDKPAPNATSEYPCAPQYDPPLSPEGNE